MKGKKTVIACMLQQHRCKVHVTDVNDKLEWLLFPTAVAAECMLISFVAGPSQQRHAGNDWLAMCVDSHFSRL